MHGSCFNVPFSFGNTYAVWNSLSGSTAVLSEKEYLSLINNQPEEIDKNRQDYLEKKGFLVHSDTELQKFLDTRYADRQLRMPYFRILTTTACNAHCTYCYEHNFPTMTMDTNTADSVGRFIAEQYKAHALRGKVCLEWFGGEPSLNPSAMCVIAEYLQRKEIPFYSILTTNGILLTEEFLRDSKMWNLQKIQITLDAANQDHESIKGVPPGTFNQILDNIDCCLSRDIRVIIRINHSGCQERIERLINVLSNRYVGVGSQPKIYISPLYCSGKSIPADYMRKIMDLNSTLIKEGLMTFDEVYDLRRRDRCFAATPWGFTIMPDGTLVNCSHNASAENSYGTIWGYNIGDSLHQNFLSQDLMEECLACPILPICGGGCPAAQYNVARMNLCIPYRNVITDILSKRLGNAVLIQSTMNQTNTKRK